MSELIQAVTDGVVQQTATNDTTSSSSNELGKEAFLQLLATQMKYQDPLNPNTDTEYVAQLATFSQLEQMQNLATVTTNSQAFSLVGQSVIVKTTSDTGNTNYTSGTVDFVNITGGNAQLSIGGSLYSIDQLDSVIDATYIIEQGLPGVESEHLLEYDIANAEDMTFDVNLGEGDTVADQIAIYINDTLLDSGLVSLSGNEVTIDKSAFTDYEIGTYNVSVIFNDTLYTTVEDKVSLKVSNSGSTENDSEEEEPAEEETV